MSVRKRILLFILMILGFGLSVKLLMIYINVNFNPYALPSFCNINNYVDCDGVAQTPQARFMGVPMAVWGLCLYAMFIFLLFVDKIAKLKIFSILKLFKNPASYITTLGIFSFCISMILACVSVFQIQKVCVLCVVTYFINLFIALIAHSKEHKLDDDVKMSFVDFYEAIKVKKNFVLLSLCVIIFFVVLWVINYYKVFIPAPKDPHSYSEFLLMKKNPNKISGNVLGEKDAKVLIHVYTDYRCPHCRIFDLMLYAVMKEVKGVWVIHHDFPLDSECNPLLKKPYHEGSCLLARYGIAAKKQSRGWDMDTLLFDNQPKDENDILKLAKKEKFDVEKLKIDANSDETKKILQDDIQAAIDLQIYATPSVVIGSVIHKGMMPYDEFKKILLKAGAEKK